MKVMQIGGTFVNAQRKIESSIHSFIQAAGHESVILYAIGESNDKNIIRYENHLLEIIRRFCRKYLGKNPHYSIFSTMNILRHIKKFQPDIVHFHVMHQGYLDYIVLLKYLAKKKIPVVFTAHDMWYFTGGCYYYTNVGCDGFKCGCCDCPKTFNELDCAGDQTDKYLKIKMELFRKLENIAFVSVSPWVYSEMMKSDLSAYPQYMIMNSIDDFGYSVQSAKKNEIFTIIGVAANWDDRKGIRRFYELGKALIGKCNIVLVGNIREELKENVPSNIHFTGSVTDLNELYRLYANSDLHVSMSLEETFGLTFVEAALSGIRSMGFDSTAIPYILDKTHGFILHSCTVDEAVAQIYQLIEKREECVISDMEQSEIRAYFSTEKMASEYLRVFETVHNKEKARMDLN